jgi:protein transport protein SEC31
MIRCELRDPAGGSISDIAWHPEQGRNIITASGDDRNPVIKLWDLRSSTSLPLVTLQGHSQGILSVSWCPSDSSLLISCGKDNRTMLWDLLHAKAVYELPCEESTAETTEISFGGVGGVAGQRKYHVAWSPCLPAVVSTCSFDRSIQFHSLSGVKSSLGRAPKWLRRPIGATFGFGGKLVKFCVKSPADAKKTTCSISIYQAMEDIRLVTDSDSFHAAIASGDLKALCEQKNAEASGAHEKEEWSVIRVLCFEPNTRQQLIAHLGFDKASIETSSKMFTAGLSEPVSLEPNNFATSLSEGPIDSKEFFKTASPPPTGGRISPSRSSVILTTTETAAVEEQLAIENDAEPMIRSALVVGNFSAAVDCCLEAGLMAEALLLSQCGDSSLWEKTQKAFFERQKRAHRLPFLDMLQAVIRNELRTFVQQSVLANWRESLALLSTYAKTEEFPVMCELLAMRLETEAHDLNSAKICYMCSMNFAKTISMWVEELSRANEIKGGVDTEALWRFITKVIIFTHANSGLDLGTQCAYYFSLYAHILASHGRLDTAPLYIRGDHLSEAVLRDRVFHAASAKAVGARAPVFPFERIVVAVGGVPRQPVAAVRPTDFAHPSPASRATSFESPINMMKKQGSSLQAAPQQQQLPTTGGLPSGWVQLVDPSSGRAYFANQALGVTQWELPLPPQQQQQSPIQTPAVSVGFSQVTATLSNSVASSQVSQPAVQASPSQQPQAVSASSGVSNEAVLALYHVISALECTCHYWPKYAAFIRLIYFV